MRWKVKCATLVIIAVFGLVSRAGTSPKLKPEDVVQRHLDSMGSADARAARKSFRAEGSGSFAVIAGGSGDLKGSATLVSQGDRLRISLVFGTNDYPGEDVAYDGKNVEVGFTKPGIRSQLGQFLFDFGEIVSEGLLGGQLSTGWSLLDIERRKPILKYDGLKKLGATEYHTLSYRRRAGGDAQIKLYFDKDNFQHIHTTYKIVIRPGMTRRDSESANLQETEYVLTESFSSFRKLRDLTLPTLWSLDLTHQVGAAGSLTRWATQFAKVFMNPEIDPATFSLGLRKSD